MERSKPSDWRLWRLAVLAILTLMGLLVGAALAAGPYTTYLPLVSLAPTPTVEGSSAPTVTGTVGAIVTTTPPGWAPSATATGTPPTATPTVTATPTASPSATATPFAEAGLNGRVLIRPAIADRIGDPRPRRFLVVLDVSGSMNMNFLGQGIQNGRVVQCASGPPGAPVSLGCGSPENAWPTMEERRIYVAKKAVEHLIRLANLPGNPGYDPRRPADQVALIWFNDRVPSAWARPFQSDPSALIEAVTNANQQSSDPYKASGGTNLAGALYRATLLLNEAPSTVAFGGATYDYNDYVIVITDGVANTFLDRNNPNMSGGQSTSSTYPSSPVRHTCNALGSRVVEHALCQTTEFGGVTTGVGNVAAGMDRPITQAVRVSQDELQPNDRNPAPVWVLAIASDVGLRDGVASSPEQFTLFVDLQRDADGRTNVDQVIDAIFERGAFACRPYTDDLTGRMPPANIPAGAALPEVGAAVLTDGAGGQVRVPIYRDVESEWLTYRFPRLPAGAYTLQLSLAYRGADGASRIYEGIYDQDEVSAQLRIDLTGADQRQTLIAGFQGDVCGP